MITLLISRFRALIAVLSIVFSLAVFLLASLYYRPYPAGLRLVDISFWILFLGSVAAGLLDISLFWRKEPPVLNNIIHDPWHEHRHHC